MDEIMYQKTYREYKAELDSELQRSAESFVRIGYLLKVARDTNILAESGYKTVAEFAEAEYSLNKTQVSRFISINDKFAENGYSERLADRFQGFGYSKLTIMLQIPEEIAEELTPDFSKAEIQAVKEEVDEENKVSDIEILMEAAGGSRPDVEMMNILEKTIYYLGESEPEIFEKIYTKLSTEAMREDLIREVMAPSGDKIYFVRIKGMGRVMLSLKEAEDTVTITPMRNPEEKQSFDWLSVAEAWWFMLQTEACSAEECWEYIYESEYPLKQKKVQIAPVQQPKKEEKKPVQKKESKVSKAKEPKKPEKTEAETAQAHEEQLPGRMKVSDYPELMPESTFKEVKNVNSDADEGKQSGAGDIDGMSAGSGNDVDAVESGNDSGMGRSELQSNDEGSGAAESGGCKGDYEGREPADETEHWREAEMHLERVKEFMKLRNFGAKVDTVIVKSMYKDAVSLAAAFESILNMRTEDEE